jgi:TetR/AcrR family acrAB operon transcriptional repressor
MRRSREDSLKTRDGILLAARRVFAKRGVTRTTMEHIATEAGVTRGAVYGHFKDKRAVFQCIREQLHLPLIDVIDEEALDSCGDPLEGVERYLLGILAAMKDDAATRETFHMMLFKCEYVDELERDIGRQFTRCVELSGTLQRAYRAAARKGKLRAGVTPKLAALDTCAFLMGLVRLWLLDGSGRLVRTSVRALVRAHIANLRAPA